MSAPGVAHGPAAAPVSTSSDAAVRSAFAKFDKNGSGALDVRELRSALGQLGLEAGRTEAQAILSKYDADGGGSLELSEFQALVVDLRRFQESSKPPAPSPPSPSSGSKPPAPSPAAKASSPAAKAPRLEDALKAADVIAIRNQTRDDVDRLFSFYAKLRCAATPHPSLLPFLGALTTALTAALLSTAGADVRSPTLELDEMNHMLTDFGLLARIAEPRAAKLGPAPPQSPISYTREAARSAFAQAATGKHTSNAKRDALGRNAFFEFLLRLVLGSDTNPPFAATDGAGKRLHALLRCFKVGEGAQAMRACFTDLRGAVPPSLKSQSSANAAIAADVAGSPDAPRFKRYGSQADAAATRVQATYKGSLARRKTGERRREQSAASSTSDSLVTDPIRRAFEALDRDHSGSLDSRELRSALRKLGLTEVDADATKAIMRKYDTDKGGRIELVEFASLVHDIRRFQDPGYQAPPVATKPPLPRAVGATAEKASPLGPGVKELLCEKRMPLALVPGQIYSFCVGAHEHLELLSVKNTDAQLLVSARDTADRSRVSGATLFDGAVYFHQPRGSDVRGGTAWSMPGPFVYELRATRGSSADGATKTEPVHVLLRTVSLFAASEALPVGTDHPLLQSASPHKPPSVFSRQALAQSPSPPESHARHGSPAAAGLTEGAIVAAFRVFEADSSGTIVTANLRAALLRAGVDASNDLASEIYADLSTRAQQAIDLPAFRRIVRAVHDHSAVGCTAGGTAATGSTNVLHVGRAALANSEHAAGPPTPYEAYMAAGLARLQNGSASPVSPSKPSTQSSACSRLGGRQAVKGKGSGRAGLHADAYRAAYALPGRGGRPGTPNGLSA